MGWAIGILLAVGCGKSQPAASAPSTAAPTAAAPAAAPAPKPIELSYSIFFPPSHIQCKTAEEWAREVENAPAPCTDHNLSRRLADQGAAVL
jgi:TRAP-type C4-dicarboxylate transport system substrate-binding protein